MKKNSVHELRQSSVRKIFNSNHLNGILFTSLENIRYLCGFTGSDGAFILTEKESFFLTDSRYWTQADEEVKGCQIVHYKKKMDGIASLLLDLKLKRIGFESPSLPFSLHQSLLEKLAKEVELHPIGRRNKKFKGRQRCSRIGPDQKLPLISHPRLSAISSRCLRRVWWRGRSALEMEFFMKKNGAEALGFDIIIASGKRSALPHGRASDKRIEKGDFILIDFGSGFRGYHSDQTRTVVCGKPSSEQEKVYQVVKEAHDKAIEKVRPGIPIGEVDAAARDYIRSQGYGEYFGHGTGHGIGLAVHEDPVVNSENKELLREGMVFTIEPGIYIPDWGGVRIEDMVLVTSQGAEVLTYLPRELRVI